jgi:hypothetical protein
VLNSSSKLGFLEVYAKLNIAIDMYVPDLCKTAATGCRFHEIEPQSSVMELLRPSQLSRKVLSPPRGCVPASELAANTLALSGVLCHLAQCPCCAVGCSPSNHVGSTT